MTAIALGNAAVSAAGGELDRSLEIEYIAHTLASTKVDGKGTNIAQSQIGFRTDGDMNEVTNDGSPSPAIGSGEWHRDEQTADLGDDWDIRATLTAGTNPTSGTQDSWINLGTITRLWQNIRNDDVDGVGITTSTLTYDWRLAGGPGTILKTVTGTILSAEILAA